MAEISDSVLVAEQTPLLLPRGEARSEAHSAECSCRKIVASAADRLTPSPNDKTSAKPYPKVADIPITCPERLLQAAVTATTATDNSDNGLGAMDRNVHPATPATTTTTTTGPPVPKTYLYLAYGSNLAAETFLGRRGIRPISRINVSAPAFDLNFGLPGLPYWEPCFANVEPRRKIPQPPHRPPFNPPKPPPIDPSPAPPSPGNPPPPLRPASSSGGEKGSVLFPALPPKDGPTWTKGLYGVVYEVTAEDYATIVKTEGGGASYKDVVTPCIPLPPSMHVPETPPIPELPRPFLAHTLYAPRLPVPPPEHDEGGAADVDEKSRESSKDDDGHDHDGDDGDHGGNDGCKGKLRKYFGRFLLPVQRPVDYAQPSLRYLTLLRDGARENDLPDEYQAYLAELHHYAITTSRQTVGKFLYGLLWFPWFALLLGVSRIFADRDTGKVPAWLGVMMTVLVNVMWASYDGVFKKWFGDGERTEAAQGDRDGDEGTGGKWNVWSGYGKRRRNSFVLPGQGVGAVRDEEKNRLLDDW